MNLLGRIERLGLAEALKNKDAARPFLSALADVVEAPQAGKATFSVLLDSVASFTVADPAPPVATWPVATILPFLARAGCPCPSQADRLTEGSAGAVVRSQIQREPELGDLRAVHPVSVDLPTEVGGAG